MNKKELQDHLKKAFGFEAREELHVAELETIKDGFEAKAELEKVHDEYKDVLGDMQAKLTTAGEAAAKAPNVVEATVGKVKYLVTSGAQLPGLGKFTAKELAADEDALKAVLEIEGQTVLKPL